MVNRLCLSGPFFISCVVQSRCSGRDLATARGVVDTVHFEAVNKQSELSMNWGEIHRADFEIDVIARSDCGRMLLVEVKKTEKRCHAVAFASVFSYRATSDGMALGFRPEKAETGDRADQRRTPAVLWAGRRTRRNLLFLSWLSGSFLSRIAERQFLASSFQEPPRTTRPDPLARDPEIHSNPFRLKWIGNSYASHNKSENPVFKVSDYIGSGEGRPTPHN